VTDERVAAILRSQNKLVVIEAPAGCGKTHQGAAYAKYAASAIGTGRVLILTHTHAARSVFAEKTKDFAQRVDIRTIDGFLMQIASTYHKVLGLPADVAVWAREIDNGFDTVAAKCRRFLECAPLVAEALSARYPIVICDEHQDASEAQHFAIMTLHAAGSAVRIFGDPMQIIFTGGADKKHWRKKEEDIRQILARWKDLRAKAVTGNLGKPHRWETGSPELGEWVLRARETLCNGGAIDLTGRRPVGLTVLFAENSAKVPRKAFSIVRDERKPIDHHVKHSPQLLILTSGNDRVRHLNAFLNRRVRIWEGHTRSALSSLTRCLRNNRGKAGPVVDGLLEFICAVAVGFSLSSHGDRFKTEIDSACAQPTSGMPLHLQAMARHVLNAPDHKGIAAALFHLVTLVRQRDKGFDMIDFDLRSELYDAIRLGSFEDPDEGLAEISRRRTFTHPKPPTKCLSTIHKSKGLECEHAMIILCDRPTFAETEYKRRLLYVGLSRATKSLTLVLSRRNPAPLFKI
jgi:hypothetical protein